MPGIHSGTKGGGKSRREEVWIKVCNIKFNQAAMRVYILAIYLHKKQFCCSRTIGNPLWPVSLYLLTPAKVTPKVSNSAADDSCLEPENTSTCLPHLIPSKPTRFKTQVHSASSRAPAIQPDHNSMLSLALWGTSF